MTSKTKTDKIKPPPREYLVSDLISKSSESEHFQETYSNHAQIIISQSEIVLDFYYIKQNLKGIAQAQHAQRIILSHNLGKGLATALANAISNYEEESGVVLINGRPKQPEDKVEIWPT